MSSSREADEQLWRGRDASTRQVWLVVRDGAVVVASEAAARLAGAPLTGRPVSELTERDPRDGSLRLVAADGGRVPLEVWGHSDRLSDGRFRNLLDRMADMVAVFDEEQLFYINPAARSYLGLPPDVDAAGMSTMSFLPPDERERARTVMRRVMATRQPAPVETFRHLFP